MQSFFLRASAYQIRTFHSQFLYELKHIVHLSKTVFMQSLKLLLIR